mmetsp:Transcript_15392/g.16752  ORF Transcript_15392/g.16752 Transcript_15392/m.16752 type:complete len:107 (+) Transcript_15392:3-323(+)
MRHQSVAILAQVINMKSYLFLCTIILESVSAASSSLVCPPLIPGHGGTCQEECSLNQENACVKEDYLCCSNGRVHRTTNFWCTLDELIDSLRISSVISLNLDSRHV